MFSYPYRCNGGALGSNYSPKTERKWSRDESFKLTSVTSGVAEQTTEPLLQVAEETQECIQWWTTDLHI